MRIRDLLLEDTGCGLPFYDKLPDAPAFVVSTEGTSILAVNHPTRVLVPMVEGLDADAMTLALVRVAAEQGSVGIEWSGSFLPVQEHFDHQALPFHVVVKHPDSSKLVLPPGVAILESTSVERDRFYCLTNPEKLGRRPTQPGIIAHGVHCPDSVGLLIFNPKGILTAFLEPGQRKFAIAPQA